MDSIHLTNLRFNGKHGCFARERSTEQEFLIELKLGVDLKKAGESDDLKDTIDYDVIRTMVQKVVEGLTRYLTEALAEAIAQKVLEDTRVVSVEVTIKKTEVWKNGVPGVTISRLRSGTSSRLSVQ
jgi:7,8-dihydroneopterin aldolase/epimerase/oxygenase